MPVDYPEVQASQIGEFIRFNSCERRVKLSGDRATIRREIPFYGRLENTLDVVLQEKGELAENEWTQSLIDAGFSRIASEDEATKVDTVFEALLDLSVGESIFAREVEIRASIEGFHVSGRIDFLLLLWRNGSPVLRIVETKASRKDQTYQRIQIACYSLMIEKLLAEAQVEVSGVLIRSNSVEAVVARVDEETRQLQNLLDLEPLDLSVACDDLRKLLAPGGPFARAASSEIHELPYQLDPKCDTCVFNVHCFPESARLRRIQLLGLRPDLVGALEDNGLSQIDELANLDPALPIARAIAADERIDEDIEVLKARASARCQTLELEQEIGGWPVTQLPQRADSLRPPHEIGGQRLVRIYLNVDYDYIEDRILSVAAHVTASEGKLEMGWRETENGFRPSGDLEESLNNESRPVEGIDIVEMKNSPWARSLVDDAASERTMLESFFRRLIDAIGDVSSAEEEYLHFYVWSSNELSRLMEAASRGGPALLANVAQLFGCRAGREQLIVTPLQTDIHRRFALGWTGRGLAVATSLRWFGSRYHWTRRVGRREVDLSYVFQQDIFDFATTLWIENGEWQVDGVGHQQRFELRSRFFDATSVAYYRALWGTIRSDDERWEADARKAIERYERVKMYPGIMRTYLTARAHALRWIDERAGWFNARIEKQALNISELSSFELQSNSPREAAIDVLRIDWTVSYMDWLATQAVSAGDRVVSGRCLPLEVGEISDGPNNSKLIRARIRPDLVALELQAIQRRYADGEGSLARALAWSGEAGDRAQSNPGACCWIQSLDWESGEIQLSTRAIKQGRYRQFSSPAQTFSEYPFILLERSVTSYTHPSTDERLSRRDNEHIDPWFDLSEPQVSEIDPISREAVAKVDRALQEWLIPGKDTGLILEQREAVCRGLNSRISALQGPPGTGKTATTAAAIAARTATRRTAGDRIVVAGCTHRAVDTLITRASEWVDSLVEAFSRQRLDVPRICLIRIEPKDDFIPGPNVEVLNLQNVNRVRDATEFFESRADQVVVLFGTPKRLLDLEKNLGARAEIGAQDLIIDEASMMVFPEMLALATLTAPGSSIMVAGDNRQLAPILAHSWEREDRPPTVRYQPFLSAYEVVARISDHYSELPNPSRISISRLRHTFRLPPATREIVGALYRRDDNFELSGRSEAPGPMHNDGSSEFHSVWSDPHGLVLVCHDERRSRKENPIERRIVRMILDACVGAAPSSIAVLTPHRAQRALLQQEIGNRDEIGVIDTVERLQGGEAPIIILSATASDPGAIANAEQFLMNVHRANVAFSRNEERLIVVASQSLLDHVSANIEVYEHSLLWKTLRATCQLKVEEVSFEDAVAEVFTRGS